MLGASRQVCGLPGPGACMRPRSDRALRPASRGIRLAPQAASAEGKSVSAADLLQATDELLRKLNSDKHAPMPPDGYLSDDDHFSSEPAFEVSCDVNGCIITPVAPRTKSPGAAAGTLAANGASAEHTPDVELHEGPGWKLVLDTAGTSGSGYDALVGSDTWAVALKKAEMVDFIQLLLNLRQSVKTLDICGEWGSNEEATLEMQSGNVYMQARASQKRLSALQDLWKLGQPTEGAEVAFDVQFSVRSPESREVEAHWPAHVVMRVFNFLDSADGWLDEVQNEAQAPAA